jgi:hypothetical protein
MGQWAALQIGGETPAHCFTTLSSPNAAITARPSKWLTHLGWKEDPSEANEWHVRVVGLGLAEVPVDTTSPKHHAGEAIVHGVFGRHNANVNKTLLPDAVPGEQLLNLIDPRGKVVDEVVDVVHQANRHVKCNATLQ